jgi:hypothetical protein
MYDKFLRENTVLAVQGHFSESEDRVVSHVRFFVSCQFREKRQQLACHSWNLTQAKRLHALGNDASAERPLTNCALLFLLNTK